MSAFVELSKEEKAQLWACLALRHAVGIGPHRAKLLVEHYGSPLNAVEAGMASSVHWVSTHIVPQATASAFAGEKWRVAAQMEWQALQQQDARFVFWSSPQYPAILREITDPPLLLYYKGNLALLQAPLIGIVGSRSGTREGLRLASFFAQSLTQAGVSVVSGMAKGIDRIAHFTALQGPGRSVAVLGTGIDVIYPHENFDLFVALEQQGLILTEFAFGTPAIARNFPVRNRIISGLSRGILVVEAAVRSGSLITARLALEQNRDVFTVPGNTTNPMSQGCHNLIRQGAKPVFTADDILLDLAPLLHKDALNALKARQQTVQNVPPRSGKDMHKSLSTSLQETAQPFFIDVPASTSKSTVRRQSKDMLQSSPLSPSVIGSPSPTPPQSGRTRQPTNIQPSTAPGCTHASVSAQKGATQPQAVVLSPEEASIVAGLTSSPLHIDTLAGSLGMDVSLVSRVLLMLEMRSIVTRYPGMYYAIPSDK